MDATKDRAAGFTPGPWLLEPTFYEDGKGFRTHTGYYVRSESREAICRVDGMDDSATADANLITASPELYAACEAALADHDRIPRAQKSMAFDVVAKLRSALANARGVRA